MTFAWMPIETAPRLSHSADTLIDLWVIRDAIDGGGGVRETDCWWEDEHSEWGWTGWTNYDETASRAYPVDGNPTHWMKVSPPDQQ